MTPTQERERAGRSPVFYAGLAIVTVFALVAVFAPVLSPYDPRALSGGPLESPSLHHLLGTNDLGQDLLSQLIWGARMSIAVAVGAAGLAVALGVLVGVGAGLAGGLTDIAAMRVVDLFLALPVLPLLVLIGALASPRGAVTVVIIGLIGWPGIARTVRSQTLSLRSRGFVSAAFGLGGSRVYAARRHLAPALGPVIVTRFVDWAGLAVALQAGLAFLGLGDPTGVSWGMILNRALAHEGLYFTAVWTWWILPAGLAISAAVLGFTFLGVGLEPTFNPRWRRVQ
jgi:ABC-type dipeptide/oligopeptide/nickel transport system permease subunit